MIAVYRRSTSGFAVEVNGAEIGAIVPRHGGWRAELYGSIGQRQPVKGSAVAAARYFGDEVALAVYGLTEYRAAA